MNIFFLKKIKYFSSTLKLRPPILVTSRIIERKNQDYVSVTLGQGAGLKGIF
jgi:hypothetical protein